MPFHCKLESVFHEADEIINVSACAGSTASLQIGRLLLHISTVILERC